MAITSSLLDKLQAIRLRFEEIGTQLTDPSVISDTKRYIKLNKEYIGLEELVAVSMEYKNILDNIESTKALLKEEKDEEMREMARAELDEMEDRIPQMEEEIKILLLPSDPEDEKNVVVEIRSGTGGDRSEEHTSELQSRPHLVCRLLLEKKKKRYTL